MTKSEVDALRAEIGERKLVVSVSGGKDSTATCLFLRAIGLDYVAVHADTGWEDTETDRYVREVLPEHIGPITIVSQRGTATKLGRRELEVAWYIERLMGRDEPSAMVRAVLHKGTFSSRRARWCTKSLKIAPVAEYLEGVEDAEPINVVGVRAEESARRADMSEWEWSDVYGCDIWRPIHGWTVEDVVAIHHEFGVPPNPLYTQGAERVGCWPCIFSRKAEIRMVSERSPKRIEAIEALERATQWLQAERYAERGEAVPGRNRAAFFESPFWAREVREGGKESARVMVPIDEVVAWSKTNRKGEREMFAPLPSDAGCVRWGLCDASWRKNVWAMVPDEE